MTEDTKPEPPSPEDQPITDAEILAHMTMVAHRVAVRIAETIPEASRPMAQAAAEEVLLSDEGARDLLAAAYADGRADAIGAALRTGKFPQPDWSDIESLGERRAMSREEHICHSCSASDVCGVAQSMRALEMLVILQRCDKHR